MNISTLPAPMPVLLEKKTHDKHLDLKWNCICAPTSYIKEELVQCVDHRIYPGLKVTVCRLNSCIMNWTPRYCCKSQIICIHLHLIV